MILNILGGGGSGKTTLKFALLKFNIFRSYVPYTTRPIKHSEIDGIHYRFISIDQFLSNSSITLKRNANGWFYGVSDHDLKRDIDKKIVITTFDANGIRELEKMGLKTKVVYLNVPEKERIRRMIQRGDNIIEIAKRLKLDRSQITDLNFTSPILNILEGNIDQIVNKVLEFVG